MKDERLNIKLKQAFKKCIREGGNDLHVKDALRDAYRKYWFESQQTLQDKKLNVKITVDDMKVLYDHSLQNLLTVEELQHFLRYGLRIFKRGLYIVKEKETPLHALTK